MNRRFPIYLLLCILFAAVVSCVDPAKQEPIIPSSNVAITSFKLEKDTGVVVNLDSVFFTIDLNNARVFNADSLPKGSKVKKLVVTIGHPIVSSAELIIKGGELMKDTTINYLTNSKDSIDFTGNVTLKLISEDKSTTREYSLKVNVHNMKPDSLYWNQLARRDLPSYSTPLAQKTVETEEFTYCLIKESSRYVIAHTDDLISNKWTKNTANFKFIPHIRSFTATNDKLYILSDGGALYSSVDGIDWESCNVNFYSLLGGYADRVLGVVYDGNGYKHGEYPAPAGYVGGACEAGFPISGASEMINYTSKWNITTQSIVIGGANASNKVIGDAWGYDGRVWAKISSKPIPALEGVTLFPYFTYKTNKNNWKVTEYTTWIAIGGRDQNGKVTKDVYISLDNGLNWKKGDQLLQLPDYMPAFSNAQAIVSYKEMSAPMRNNDGWELINSKELPVWFMVTPSITSRGYVEQWECPYIYMFGGENDNSVTFNNIWKGVLNRLSFKPLI